MIGTSINNYTRLSIFPDGVYDDMDTGLIS